MNEYVPTMNDVKHWLCEPTYAGGLFDDETAAKFDVALAAHDAEIAAKALSDIAEELTQIAIHADAGFGYDPKVNAEQLRARAAEYRKEEEVSENVVGVMTAEEAIEMVMQRPGLYGLHTEEELAEAWDEGHGAPCDKWIRAEMCREYHPNPYRKAGSWEPVEGEKP